MDQQTIARNRISNRITDRRSAAERCADWQRSGLKVVFTNGCFDIIHKGHVMYLAEAAAHGDKLVVGVNTDTSTRRLKGPDRPINSEDDRAAVLAALESVDLVVLFDEDTPKALIEAVKPDVLIKGGDYQLDQIVGADFVRSRGGIVRTVPFLSGYSTSRIEEKIRHAGEK